MKKDFDCDTCSWFENGRCINLNRNAYYPCPEWLRRFDPEKLCNKVNLIDTKTYPWDSLHKHYMAIGYIFCPGCGKALHEETGL